jgi:hypothetical protein
MKKKGEEVNGKEGFKRKIVTTNLKKKKEMNNE